LDEICGAARAGGDSGVRGGLSSAGDYAASALVGSEASALLGAGESSASRCARGQAGQALPGAEAIPKGTARLFVLMALGDDAGAIAGRAALCHEEWQTMHSKGSSLRAGQAQGQLPDHGRGREAQLVAALAIVV